MMTAPTFTSIFTGTAEMRALNSRTCAVWFLINRRREMTHCEKGFWYLIRAVRNRSCARVTHYHCVSAG